jgi:hypothetical protein
MAWHTLLSIQAVFHADLNHHATFKHGHSKAAAKALGAIKF